jgi:hypothetical protein
MSASGPRTDVTRCPLCGRYRGESGSDADIGTAAVDSLKALDPNRPIREADVRHFPFSVAARPGDRRASHHAQNRGHHTMSATGQTAIMFNVGNAQPVLEL